MTPDMEIVAICQEMKWTYWDYMEQPNWFLDLVSQKLQIDSEKIRKEIDKTKLKNRK
ncbi:MAG: hypothetical protein ACTSO3_13510 [Candidatus Heimdallarchaeaceae archaeon]